MTRSILNSLPAAAMLTHEDMQLALVNKLQAEGDPLELGQALGSLMGEKRYFLVSDHYVHGLVVIY